MTAWAALTGLCWECQFGITLVECQQPDVKKLTVSTADKLLLDFLLNMIFCINMVSTFLQPYPS
jgi:hypothetical protein